MSGWPGDILPFALAAAVVVAVGWLCRHLGLTDSEPQHLPPRPSADHSPPAPTPHTEPSP